jgi:hypothetical protein
MAKGELWATDNNQHRLTLGTTPNGDIAFATRGGNVRHDYDSCQIQDPTKFQSQASKVGFVPTVDFQRVEAQFAAYLASNNVT